MKKLSAFLLSLVLLLGLAMPASAATAKAVTMHVELVEGSVTIKDASGITLSYFQGIQLYSGYSVATGDSSCAYISLDDTKAIKLDVNTSVTIKKSGRKLQVKLLAGQIVFNVTAPLAGDEALEIRTSTMVTGIRGSSGVVSLRYILYGTGHGIIHQADENSILPRSFDIWGGQILNISGDGSEMKVEDAQISDFPSAYLKEVEQNEQLQESLNNEGNYSTEEMIAEIPASEEKEQTVREEAAIAMIEVPTINDEESVNPAFSDDGNDTPAIPEEGSGDSVVSHIIVWKNGNEILSTESVRDGMKPQYSGETPTKAADAQYTYTFSGWVPDITYAFEDATYTAQFDKTTRKYKITWKMDDGSVIDTAEAAYGAVPTHDDPQKAADAQYTYTFTGWTPEITDVTKDAAYTAIFSKTVNQYIVTFVDEDGTVLKEAAAYDYGTAAADIVKPADPTKAATDEYTYTFAGWSPAVTVVTEDVTYRATYSDGTVNQYTVTFVDEDGTVLKEATAYDYGTAAADIVKPADPTKEATAQYTYTFAGWGTITDVTENATYTATYSSTVNQYTVTFVDEDGTTVLKEAAKYNYGTTADDIVKPGDPTKAATAQYTYTFAGWGTIADVTENATYIANYSSTVNQYTVTFVKDDGTVLKEATAYDYGTPAASIDVPDLPAKTSEAEWIRYINPSWDQEITSVTEDATYAATYTTQYRVTFWLKEAGNEQSDPKWVTNGETASTDLVSQQVGHKIVGWYKNESYTEPFDLTTPITGESETILYAKVSPIQYTVTLSVPAEVDDYLSIYVTDEGEVPYDVVDSKILALYGDVIYVTLMSSSEYCCGPKTEMTAGDILLASGANGNYNYLPYEVQGDATINVTDVYKVVTDLENAADMTAITGNVTFTGSYTLNTDLFIAGTGALTLNNGSSLTVGEGVTLTINGTITNNGTLTNNGTINSYGTIYNNGTLTNNGTLNNYSGNTIANYGQLFNLGTLNNGATGGTPIDGRIVNEDGAYLFNCGTLESHTSGSTVENAGVFLPKDSNNSASEFRYVSAYGDALTGSGTVLDYGGLCNDDGSNVTWYLTDSATVIHITGTGAIQDYEATKTGTSSGNDVYSVESPWWELKNGITVLELGNQITGIGAYAFAHSKITSVSFPASVKYIGNHSFYGSALSSVDIGTGVTDIRDHAFTDCDSLRSIVIPDNVTSIGITAFYSSTLRTVTIGSGVKSIEAHVFGYCTNLTTVTLPEGLEVIGFEAFVACSSNLSTIDIPSTVTKIDNSAFYSCKQLAAVYFYGDPPTTFGTEVFTDTSNNLRIYYPDYNTNWKTDDEGKWNGYTAESFDPAI